MPSSLADIMQQISAPYQAQRDLIAQQQAALGGQEQSAIQGADAQKDIAFDQIRQTANNDGVLYSGRPSEMSNRYVAANYAPAIAGIKSQTMQQGSALQQALLNVQQQQGQQAYGMYNDQLNREQQQQQFQQQLNAQTKQYQQQLAASQSAGKPANVTSALTKYFQGYNPKTDSFYTEHTVAPQLMSDFGLTYDQALKQAYQYRKQVFNQ